MRDFGTDLIREDGNNNSKDGLAFLHKNRLNLAPNECTYTYAVSSKFFDENQEESKRLNYRVDINYVNSSEKGHFFEVSKSEFYINQKAPSLIIEEIVAKISDSLYPIAVFIDHTGKVQEVTNIIAIQKRWETLKPFIQKEYKGEVIDGLIKQYESILQSPVKFEISLQKDPFWNIFFHTNYQVYNKKNKFDNTINSPLLTQVESIFYKGKNTIKPKLSRNNKIVVNFKGTCSFIKKSNLSRMYGSKALYSEIGIEYHLDNKTHVPVLIQTTSSLFTDTDEHLKTVTLFIALEHTEDIKQTKFDVTEVTQEDTDKRTSKKKQKGFFSFLKK